MREKPRDIERMQHMFEAVNDILEFAAGKSFDDFKSNKMMKHAIFRDLAVVGEAANLLTKEYRAAHSDIAWNEIIGMRHVLVHGYYEADETIVWQTIIDDLPKLRAELVKLV